MLSGKIKKLLDSEDLEMVRLGTRLMQAIAPPDQWRKILEAFSYRDAPNDLWIKKWMFVIDGDEVTITPTMIDLWAMRQKIDTPLLSLVNSTGTILVDSNEWKWEIKRP